MLDLIIRNGTVIDGTGSPKFKADIGIKNDSVIALREVTGSATVSYTHLTLPTNREV